MKTLSRTDFCTAIYCNLLFARNLSETFDEYAHHANVHRQAGGTSFDVSTGRRDGLISKSSNVNLPGPTIPVPQAIGLFNGKGLSASDMVTLLGMNSFLNNINLSGVQFLQL